MTKTKKQTKKSWIDWIFWGVFVLLFFFFEGVLTLPRRGKFFGLFVIIYFFIAVACGWPVLFDRMCCFMSCWSEWWFLCVNLCFFFPSLLSFLTLSPQNNTSHHCLCVLTTLFSRGYQQLTNSLRPRLSLRCLSSSTFPHETLLLYSMIYSLVHIVFVFRELQSEFSWYNLVWQLNE